jgi:hypothetical protein
LGRRIPKKGVTAKTSNITTVRQELSDFYRRGLCRAKEFGSPSNISGGISMKEGVQFLYVKGKERITFGSQVF